MESVAVKIFSHTDSHLKKCNKHVCDSVLGAKKRCFDENQKRHEELSRQIRRRTEQITALVRALSDGRLYMNICMDADNIIRSPYVYSRKHVGFKLIFELQSFIELHSLPPNASLAVSLIIAEGEMDGLLYWPFSQLIEFTFLDFINNNHVRKRFLPDSTDPSFQQPLRGSNGNRPALCVMVDYREIGHCFYRDLSSGRLLLHILIKVDDNHPTRDQI